MGAPQYEQAGADIGGTGTTNTIPRWTGPSTLGDSIITQDDGTNRLLVAGGVAAASTAGAPIRINGQNATGPGNLAGGNIVLMPGAASGTGAVGYVGINIAAPDSRLQVWNGQAGANNAGLRIAYQNGQTNYYDGLHWFRTSTGADTLYMSNPASGGGNVGIGTASPDSKTQIVGASSSGTTRFYYNATSTHYIDVDNCIFRNKGGTAQSMVVDVANKNVDLSTTAGWGLKLPATPGNADTQTLDCYQENTWAPTIANQNNCSAVVVSNARYTRIGRLVTIEGTATLTITSATTTTYFSITLPFNRQSNAVAGAGTVVDDASFAIGGVHNAGANATNAYIVYPASNPFGAGTSRTLAFSYSYFSVV